MAHYLGLLVVLDFGFNGRDLHLRAHQEDRLMGDWTQQAR
jgi:hypothetical protein